jgi:hypothetical protein
MSLRYWNALLVEYQEFKIFISEKRPNLRSVSIEEKSISKWIIFSTPQKQPTVGCAAIHLM